MMGTKAGYGCEILTTKRGRERSHFPYGLMN
jgi:hypothetical protein